MAGGLEMVTAALRWQINVQYRPIQEQQSAQSLVVRPGRNLTLSRQHGEKRLHFCHAHFWWMLHRAIATVPANENLIQ